MICVLVPWEKNEQWEETFQEGVYKNSIVVVENLELDVSSKELEVREKREGNLIGWCVTC